MKFWGSRKSCLILATMLGAILRMMRLGFQPLWWDEGYTVWFVGRSVLDMVRLTSLDIHPPLYYALLHLWSIPIGLGPIGLRIFSVIVGVVSIPLIYLLGREIWGKKEGCLAAWILAIAPFHVYYSQEVRMYVLVTLFGMLVIFFGHQFLSERGGKWALAGYVLTVTSALYTQYYAAFVWIGVAIYVYFAVQKSKRMKWAAAQVASLVLYLPWILYAGTRLIRYVQGKVVADADRPLGLGMYLARHFATFAIGHLDGKFAHLWPLGLLVWFPLFALLGARDKGSGYLATVLGVTFAGGFLLNLKYPFAPVHGERLLLIAAPAAWLLLSRSLIVLHSEKRAAFLSSFLLLSAVGLVSFYTVPRYPNDDYRPVIAQINQQAAPGDSIYCVYPWQVGYWWSYGRRPDVKPVMPKEGEWGTEDRAQIEQILSKGGMWFPEHETLGAILEGDVERYLEGHAVPLRNSWFGNTRLTAWTSPKTTLQGGLAHNVCFEGSICLESSRFGPQDVRAENRPITLELGWKVGENAEDATVGIHLVDEQGNLWSIRDSRPLNGDLRFSEIKPGKIYRDLHGIIVPVGTPPGSYLLRLSLHLTKSRRVLSVLDAGGHPIKAEVTLAKIKVKPQRSSLPPSSLPVQRKKLVHLRGGVDFLGYSMPDRSAWTPGDDVLLNLFWKAESPQKVDLVAFAQLLSGRKMVAGWEAPPAPSFPSSKWQAGFLLRQQVKLHLPPTLKDGKYKLIAGLYRSSDRKRLEVESLFGDADHIELGEIKIRGRRHRYEPYTPAHSIQACFGKLACLQGYSVEGSGKRKVLKLYWRVVETTDTRYTVFLHVLDSSGKLVSAQDSEPAGGRLPTTTWLPGEYIEDIHDLEMPPGSSRIAVGLYEPSTNRRLPVLDSKGNVVGDKVVISLP